MSTETTSTAKPKQSWRSSISQIAAVVLAVFVAKGALAEPFYVPSASMEPTLLIGMGFHWMIVVPSPRNCG